MDRSEFYTTTEAATVMMCTSNHVRQLVYDGKLPAYYVGKRAYIPRTAIYQYIQSQTVNVPREIKEPDEDR